jgi:hypothetical protein
MAITNDPGNEGGEALDEQKSIPPLRGSSYQSSQEKSLG